MGKIKRVTSFQKTVTVAGTREALSLGQPYNTQVQAVTIRALSSNTGIVYVGDSIVAAANGYTLTAGETISFSIDGLEWNVGSYIDLTQIWLDVSVGGEGVCVTYLRD